MDVQSNKRVINGVVMPRKVLRNTADKTDEKSQLCSRNGCSGRSNRVGITDKPGASRHTSNSSKGKDVVGYSSSRPNVRKDHQESQRKSFSHNQSSKAKSTDVGCSSGTSRGEPQNIIFHKPASSCNPSKAISSKKQPCSRGVGYGLRNLKCNSISDVLINNCSGLESRVNRRDMVKRRHTEGESSSSAKGKKMAEASPKYGHVTSRQARGISIAESRSSRSNGVSVQTRRSMNVNSRFRGPLEDSLQTHHNLDRPETPNLNQWSSSQLQADGSSSDSSAFSFPGNDIDDLPDEELTHEQLLGLETNLLISSLNFHDQHQGMRLDIDSMSYEELLALEERMGTVSTALSEEALALCLKRNIYREEGAFRGDGNEDESKCSICQEEYVVGNEIGKLECKHSYHVECVQQWLRLKNWCPICKASVKHQPSTR